jgi:hypothetical protein
MKERTSYVFYIFTRVFTSDYAQQIAAGADFGARRLRPVAAVRTNFINEDWR